MPTYVNTQHIDAQVLAALQAEAENVPKGNFAAGAKDSPPKDLFDMSKCTSALNSGNVLCILIVAFDSYPNIISLELLNIRSSQLLLYMSVWQCKNTVPLLKKFKDTHMVL